jgi:F-box and leucine-rich repeat protein GRR1
MFQQAAYRVFSGENITGLRNFLDKEERRRQAAESQNVKFIPRADDKLDL